LSKNGKRTRKLILVSEPAAILLLILFLWLEEMLDLPRLVLGAPATPVNLQEAAFETVVILILGLLLWLVLYRLQKALVILEGILPVCASCKRIRDDHGQWTEMETFLHKKTQADFTHGLCPDCARKLYPGLTGNS